MMARILMRTVSGVSTHFPARAGEWWCAAMLTDWGLRVAQPDTIFGSSASFSAMERLFSEQTWGVLAIVIGVTRLIALVINGTFSNHLWYSRRSPHIRSAMAFLSVFVWALIALSLWRSGLNTTGLSIYPYLAAFDIYNAVRAGRDAGSMDRSYSIARGQPAHA